MLTIDKVKRLVQLKKDCPDSCIEDRILSDVIKKNNYRMPYRPFWILELWSNSQDKASVELMFYEFTGMTLSDYVDLAIEETKKAVESASFF